VYFRARVLASVPALAVLAIALASSSAGAQTISQRGFVEGRGFFFPQDTPNDTVNLVGDGLAREEVFLQPSSWFQFAAGMDFRANSHDQVDESWKVDWKDRGILRPAISVRRFTATLRKGPLSIDAGKQFIRWGKTDIVTPTDRFAPRDFLNVIDTEFIAITAVRTALQIRSETFEAVWSPFLTPSRIPLVDQRWTSIPAGPVPITLVDAGAAIPDGSEVGVRWSHQGQGYEFSGSYFDGFNHLPNIDATPISAAGELPVQVAFSRRYPSIKVAGGDTAIPTRWFTIKGEAAYFKPSDTVTDEYVLYVIQLERQVREWSIVGGYAGEHLVQRGTSPITFAPDRGMSKSIVAKASYTIDPNRTASIEGAVRQDLDGMYTRGEYSQALGNHWRYTLTAALIRGEPDDFLGQYRLNSHVSAALRLSF